MDEQDLVKQKIEKKEKTDIMLAYIMLGVILACIVFILYLKFVRKEVVESDSPEVASGITLSDIRSELDDSVFASEVSANGGSLDSVVDGNNLAVTYTDDDATFTMNMTLVGNELAVVIDKDNEEKSHQIYLEVGTIICTYNGNPREDCVQTITNAKDNPVDGIRYATTNNTETIYLDINKKIDVSTVTSYTEKIVTSISDTNYNLIIDNIRIDHIKLVKTDEEISVSGNIFNSDNEDVVLDVLLTIYDENEEELANQKYSFTEEEPLNSSNNFTIKISIDDEFDIEDATKYSLEVIRAQ